MAEPLSAFEQSVSTLSAAALAWTFPSPPGIAGFVAVVSFYCFAKSTLMLFLLIVKNGGGWPE